MSYRTFILFTFLILLFGTSCKKDKDIVTTQDLYGMVYNQCTDSGLAGVTVYLKINKKGSSYQSFNTISGTNGDFNFTNIEIHSSSKYSYAIYIPSKSGIAAKDPSYTGFNGTTMEFDYDQADIFFTPKVVPKYYSFTTYFNQTALTSNSDSVVAVFEQKIFHKNVPILPYILSNKTWGDVSNYSWERGNYPMGLWNITVEIWKSGVYTIMQDSIYLGWADTKTYTIDW